MLDPPQSSLNIEAREFEAILSTDGPTILCAPYGVQLGFCCSIERLGPDMGMFCHDVAPASCWIAKYRNQPRIHLAGLTALGRTTLALEFGIPIRRVQILRQPQYSAYRVGG
jgi:hypothetical protein